MAARKRKATKATKAKAPTQPKRKGAPRSKLTKPRKRAVQERKPKRSGGKPAAASRPRARSSSASTRAKKTKPTKPTKAQRARKEKARKERERKDRRNELSRRRRKRTRSEERGNERDYFATILEDMRDRAPIDLSLAFTEPEAGARTPWLIVGRFDPPPGTTYAELDEVFRAWERDLILEARIHPQRLSQIRLVYADPKAKRGESDSIVSHIGPWEGVISEIAAELDPDDPDSLSARYKETTVPMFYVYFSTKIVSLLDL